MSAFRRKAKAGEDKKEKRILVLDQNKCKKGSPAWNYLKQYAGRCGKQCIQIIDTPTKKCVSIWEECCPVCINRAKSCPGGAVTVIKLPTNLDTDTTHRFGPNSFKLHGLPIPRPGHVLGIIGVNGIGKSTTLQVLAGKLKPNLGCFDDDPPSWGDIITCGRAATYLPTLPLHIISYPT